MKYDVFISHSSEDKVIANKICEYLEDNNIKCWIAPRDIVGGLAYARGIFKGIDESQVLLLIFSANSNRSRHVESEIDRAFNKEKIIIPFRVEDCSMSDVLSYYMSVSHHIDGFPVSDEALERLKESIISNLPERSVERDQKETLAKAASFLGMSVDELLVMKEASVNKVSEEEIQSTSDEFDKLLDDFLKSPLSDVDKNSPLSNEVGQSGRYSILQNAKGEIMLMMDARVGEPDKPRFIYDGTDEALLYRSPESSVAFRKIAESAHDPIKNVSEVLVVEIFNDDVLREYTAPVRLVKDVNKLIIS